MRTLASINLKVFSVTVVDDCSKEPMKTNFPITNYIRLEKNSGPGWARQIGINNTHNDYIAFIDSGDVYLSHEIQEEIERTVIDNPQVNLFSWPYLIDNGITDQYDNRLHGNVYKRSFLEKYNITFSKEGSYANEDVGFNRMCRIATRQDGQKMYYLDIPVMRFIKEENSITTRNNSEFIYRYQTRGLSINEIHLIEWCKSQNIDYVSEMHVIAGAMYYWFIMTAINRPEFIQEAWSGAKIYFDKYKDEIIPNQLISGNSYIKKIFLLKKEIHFPINILRFVDEITKNEIVPNKYLT